MVKVFEAFAGYRSQSMALKRYGVKFTYVGMSEIDISAIIAGSSVHEPGKTISIYPNKETMRRELESKNIGYSFKYKKCILPRNKGKLKQLYNAHKISKNYGDIAKINPLSLPDMDFFSYSFPCQDISMAGKQAGCSEDSGSRSSLLWECLKIIEFKRPKFLMMENVKNLIGKKHKEDFEKWLKCLEDLGYRNYWKIIDAKKSGVPQSRERVFCFSTLVDIKFEFYNDFDNGIRLKDILETHVDEKYYISDDKTKELIESLESKGYEGYERSFYPDNTSYCIDSNYHKGISPNFTGTGRRTHIVEQNKINMIGMLNIKGNECIRRVYEPGGVSPALTTMQGGNRQPKVIEALKDFVGAPDLNGYSRTIRCGGLTSLCKKSNFANIVEACRITGINPDNPKSREAGLPTVQMIEKNKDTNISNCLTTVQKDTVVLETSNFLCYVGGLSKKDRVGDGKSLSRNQPSGNRVYDARNIACTQTAQGGGLGGHTGNYLVKHRIRRLTPTECFRLMDVSEDDISLMLATGLSNSQLYKLAGNSIVVSCMKFLEKMK